MAELLRADNVSKHYRGVCALRNAHLNLQGGEVHALVGENGAGKSTLARIIAGLVEADTGDFFIEGRRVAIRNPLEAQRLKIGIIHQELDLFPDLTVGENIVIGNPQFRGGPFVNFAKLNTFCGIFLEQVGLRCGPRALVSSLSIAQMQLLAIARALSVDARLILMDEPTSSLFGDAAETLFRLIAALKARGVTIVYVSHKMDEIFRLCDRITVLRDGETVGTRETNKTSSEEVIRMMVGRDLDPGVFSERHLSGEVLLQVSHLTTRKLTDVSFELRRGEVTGVAGLVGSGRSELGAALFGIDRIKGGSIHLNSEPFVPRSPSEAMRLGIGLVPEDRKLQGLMMQMSVIENSTITVLSRMQKFGLIERRHEFSAMDPIRRRLALKCESYMVPVSHLSGGNQQKAMLARWLLLDPDVLFLDDPARGIDVAAKQDIYRIIDELAASGKGIILVSSELPELLRCSDRILVLNNGRIAVTYERGQATMENIMAAATAGGPVAKARS